MSSTLSRNVSPGPEQRRSIRARRNMNPLRQGKFQILHRKELIQPVDVGTPERFGLLLSLMPTMKSAVPMADVASIGCRTE